MDWVEHRMLWYRCLSDGADFLWAFLGDFLGDLPGDLPSAANLAFFLLSTAAKWYHAGV